MGFKHLERWPGNFWNSENLKRIEYLQVYIEMTFYATLSTFQVPWDSDPTIASKKLSGIAIKKWGKWKAASPVRVQYSCKSSI